MSIPFRKAAPVILILSAIVFGMLPTRTNAQQAELTIAKSIEILNELAINPKNGPPKPILLKAEGIAIIPDQVTAGFVLGASFGRGVVMVRKPDGSWSNPVFINSFGGSFGLQAGAQATDLVLVFKGRRSVESFLNGKGKMTLGIDASAAAGPVGRNFEAGTDLAFKAEILSYSRSRGIFAGVSAAGGTLSVDRKANAQYYTLPIGSGEILADNSSVKAPPSAAILRRVLTGQTGIPITRKGKTQIPIEPVEGEPTIVIEGDETEEIETATPTPAPRSSSTRSKSSSGKTTVIEEDDEPEIEAPLPNPASRKSAPQSKNSGSKSARLDRKRSVTSTVDDDVMLATSPVDSDEETPEPAPRPTRKTRSTSWKKSSSSVSASKTTRSTASAKSDLEAEIDDTASSVSRSDDR